MTNEILNFDAIPIISGDDASFFKKEVCHEMESNMRFMKIWEVSNGGEVSVKHPKSVYYEVKDAIVTTGSDIIPLYKGSTINAVIYDKSSIVNNKKTIFKDANSKNKNVERMWLDSTSLSFSLPANVLTVDEAINFCFTHDFHFAHCLIEVLPGLLWCIENKIDGDIIASRNVDRNILEIINIMLMVEGSSRKVILVDEWQSVLCHTLKIPPKGSSFLNHANTLTHCDTYCTKWARDILNSLPIFLRDYLSINQAVSQSKKIFLSRDGARSVTNKLNVEKKFESNGYEILSDLTKKYGQSLDLRKKFEIYGTSNFIAGFAGSAFLNLIFAHEDTKVLMLGSTIRSLDTIYPTLFGADRILYLNCPEINSNIHSDFTVPYDLIDDCINDFESHFNIRN